MIIAISISFFLILLSGVLQAVQENYRDYRSADWFYWKAHAGRVGLLGWFASWMMRNPSDRPYNREAKTLIQRLLRGWRDMWWDGYHGVKTAQFVVSWWGVGLAPFVYIFGAWGYAVTLAGTIPLALVRMGAFEWAYRSWLQAYR